MHNPRSLFAATAVAVVLTSMPAAAADPLLSLHMPVTGSAFYDAGPALPSAVFPFHNVTDGYLNDIWDGEPSPNHWSFWLTPDGTNGWVQVDLGDSYRITRIEVQDTHNWNHRDRGTADFAIGVSDDGVAFTPVIDDAFSSSDWASLTIRGFDLSGVQGRYVRFEALSRYGYSAGLNELSVYGLPVPEPQTYLLMAAGLGWLVTLARRRRD